jgi:predicted S18 family serine protease
LIFPASRTTSFDAAGISDLGKGVMVRFDLSSEPGDGKTLVNVANARYKEDTEQSFFEARLAAEKTLGASFETTDLTLDVEGDRSYVSGESAGSAFAIAIMANHLGRRVRNDAVISAALDEDGFTLNPIGGADEKIISAIESGKTLFVISTDQDLRYENDLSKKITIARASNIRQAFQLIVV